MQIRLMKRGENKRAQLQNFLLQMKVSSIYSTSGQNKIESKLTGSYNTGFF